jgi:hypothetical protein
LSAIGLGVDNKAKVKLRAGLNLKDFKAYLRIRVRTEPINSFNIAEGLHILGKIYTVGIHFMPRHASINLLLL